MFIETSAKAGHNVKVLFKKIAQALPGMDKDAEAANGAAAANKSEFAYKARIPTSSVTDQCLCTLFYRYRRDSRTSTSNQRGWIGVQVLSLALHLSTIHPHAILCFLLGWLARQLFRHSRSVDSRMLSPLVEIFAV